MIGVRIAFDAVASSVFGPSIPGETSELRGLTVLQSCLPPETSLLYPHRQDEDPTLFIDALVCSGLRVEGVAALAFERYSVSSSNTLANRHHSPRHIWVHHFELEALSISALEVACEVLDSLLVNCVTRCRSVLDFQEMA